MFLLVLIGAIGTIQAQSVNFNCDFESDTTGWHFLNGSSTNYWTIDTAINHTANGSTSLYITNDATHSHAYTVSSATYVCAYQEFALEAGTYDFRYDWLCNGEGFSYTRWDYLRVALVPASETITPGSDPSSFYRMLPYGWVSLDNDNALNGSTSWQTITGEANITTAGTYKLAFFFRCDGGGGSQPPAAIDNIMFKLQTCPTPNNFAVSDVTSSSATVAWSEVGTATLWQLEYGPYGFTRGTGTIVNDVLESSYTINDLNANTAYEVYIESVCDVTDISNTLHGTFRTACGDLVLPYTETFESYEDDAFPCCWFYKSGDIGVLDDNYHAYSGEKSLNIEENGVLLTPQLPIPLNEAGIYFAASVYDAYSSGSLEIGYVTDTAAWDYVKITTLTCPLEDYTRYEIDFDAIDETEEAYIVIKQVGATNNYAQWNIDDFTIFQLGDCRAPTDFYFNGVTDNSVVLHWSCPTDGANFQIQYMNDENLVSLDATGVDSLEVTGLESNTSYSFEIRTMCGSDSSYWQDFGTIRTKVTCSQLLDLTINNTSTSTIGLSWVYSNAGVATPDQALVRYKESEATDWTEVPVTGTSYFLTGVQPNETYDIEVAVLCGTDTSSSIDRTVIVPSGVCGESIGNGITTDHYVPTYGFYKYSYSQAIYSNLCVAGMDTIRGIAYHTTDMPMSRSIVVYMANTNKPGFTGGDDYVVGTELTEVYSGSYSFSGNGWDTITFTTPFVTEGNNVVVAVTDNTGTYSSDYSEFYVHDGSALRLYRDGSAYDINNPGTMTRTSNVPDVRFIGNCHPITCKAPIVACNGVTSNSISLIWSAGLDETSWTVDYRVVGTNDWINATPSTTDLNYTISGLNSSTAYDVRVGSLCTEDTMYGYATGYTECDVIDIPYYESFSANQLPCWNFGNISMLGFSLPKVSGGRLSMNANSYAILPQMSSPINTLQLRFKMDDDGDNIPLYIGVVAESDNITSFVPIDTAYVFADNPDADVVVRLNNYTGDYNYIAMIAGPRSLKIDNLYVEEVAACPQPLRPHVVAAAGTHATIAWETDASAVSWDVVIVPTGADPSTGTPISTTESTIELTGLLTSTNYDVYITANCAGDVASEAAVLSFTTMNSDPIVLPYMCDFTNPAINSGWTFFASAGSPNTWAIGSAASNVTPNAMYISSDNGATNIYTDETSFAVAYLPIQINEAGQYAFAFDWRAVAEGGFDFGRVALVPGPYDFNTMLLDRYQYQNSLPNGWISMDNNSKMGDQADWKHETFKQTLTPGIYYMVAIWANDPSICHNPPLAIDNVEILHITCLEPENVQVTNITANEATVSWNSNENALNGWEISINGSDPMIITDTFYTFTDLLAGTGYNVSIRTLCTDEDHSLVTIVPFYTECTNIEELPYRNNFDAESPNNKGVTPHCWICATPEFPSVSIQYSSNPSLHFECYQSSYNAHPQNMVSLPRLGDGILYDNLELEFSAKSQMNSTHNKLYVGVATDPNDVTTFTALDTLDNFTTEWANYVVSFANYADTGRYITFFAQADGSYNYTRIQVDDVVLQNASPCLRPISAYIDSYTHHSITVNWQDTNYSALFKVAYSTNNDVFSAENVISDIDAGPYTIDNLDGATTYYVWVAADCAGFDTISGWVYAGHVTTHPTCAPVTNLEVIDIDETRATLTWHSPVVGEPITDYIVSYQKVGGIPIIDTVQVPYYFLTNLEVDQPYSATVTTMCDTSISSGNICGFVPTTPPGCTTMGHGGQTSYNYPVPGIWRYGMCQMLFLNEEFAGMGDTINGITFQSISSASRTSLKVYMAETDLNEFGDHFIPFSDMTLVYDGGFTITNGPCPINFTTPFVRTDHTKNLVVVINDYSGNYDNSSNFIATNMNKYLTLYKVTDGSVVDENTSCSRTTIRPDLVFDATCEPITCFPPSIVFTNVTDTQIDIVWRAGNDETSWRVEYKNSNDDDWTVLTDNATQTSASITNLMPGQYYNIRVGSNCSEEIAYRTISTYTECGPMPLPFKENFNNDPAEDLDKQCWVAGGQTLPRVANLVMYGHMVLLYDDSYMALPEMNGNLNELQIRFRYLSSNDTLWTLFGYMDNPNNISTFHAIDTIYDHNPGGNGWTYTERMNNLPDGTTGYFAFYTPHDLNYTFVDDIIVEPINPCIEPTDVTVSNITATTADVAWTGTAGGYIVEYGESGYELGTGSRVSVTGTSTQLTGLTSGVRYDIYVYAVCGADTSYESNVAYAMTECVPITDLPYDMNFELAYLPASFETEILPYCWGYYIADSNVTVEDSPQIIFDQNEELDASNGEYVMRMVHTSIVALPEFEADLSTLCIRFNDYVESPSSLLVVGTLDNLSNAANTFNPIDTITPAIINESVRYSVFFDNYTGSDHYIAFKNIDADPNLHESGHAIDSIIVEVIPECPEVTHIKAIAASSSTLTVDWRSHNDSISSWEVEYGPRGFELGTGTSMVVTTHPIVINNLEMLKPYDVWVRPICNNGDTGFFGDRPLTAFTSVCDAPLVSTTAPNGITGTNSNFPFGTFYRHSYSQTIIDATYLADQSEIAAISFSTNKPSNNRFNNCRIWIGHTDKTSFNSTSDWYATNNMQLVYTGNMEFEAGEVTIAFDSVFNYDGTSNIIVAIDRDDGQYESGHDFDIVSDNVAKTLWQHSDSQDMDPATLSYSGNLESSHTAFKFITCAGDVCANPILTNVTDLTYESATINWVDMGEGVTYEVAMRAQDEAEMSDPIAITTNSYTFTNLTPNVTYAYYVRQVCDVETALTSEWVEGLFTTADLPCFTPTDLAVVSKTAETVTLTWTPVGEQDKWSIHVYNTMEDHIDTVTAIPSTVVGLTGGMSYNVSVNAICATDYVSEWCDPIEFTTTDCLPVSNVAISGITESSAKVTWTAGGSESNWEINYGYADFGQGEGEIVQSNTNSYTITGLESETEYDVYVRAMCSTNFNSVWSDVVTFETLSGDNPPEGIDGVDGNYRLAIYPNPTSGATTIKLNGVEGEVEINIVDMNGRTVTTEIINCGSDCEKRLDVTGLAQGTYFVRVLGDNINSVRKLIVR